MGGRGSASGLTGASIPAPEAPDLRAVTPAAAAAAAEPEAETKRTPARVITRADVEELQHRMGQTGYEAGDPDVSSRRKLYVKTSKSFNINQYLRSGGTSITVSPELSTWERDGYTIADAARAVRQIDAGMRPLPEDIALTRFVGDGALGAILGNPRITSDNVARIIRSISTPDGAAKFSRALRRADYTEAAYTSTSYLQSHPSYDVRQIRLNIVAKKGTPAIVTNNHAENEILLGRGRKYKFTGGFRVVTTPKGVQQLEIDVEI